MENYRMDGNRPYFAVVCQNRKTCSRNIEIYNNKKEQIKNYLENNRKDLKINQIVKIENVKVLEFFMYHDKLPVRFNQYKFDFIKYVLGANIDEKYRPEI